MFKTASFKVHNPTRHKTAALKYALTRYHQTLKSLVERAVADSGLEARITTAHFKTGRPRLDKAALSRHLYAAAPRALPISPLRDYLISDAMAMLLSYYAKRLKGDQQVQPPAMPRLEPLCEADVALAMSDFARRIEWPMRPQHVEFVNQAMASHQPRVARRREATYRSWAASKAAGAMLRQTEVPARHPIQFGRCEFDRGFLLAKRENRLYCLVRLFSAESKYVETRTLEPGFANIRTGELLEGRPYPGMILPLELGRDHQEAEFIAHGRPQSAKLILRREPTGSESFYVNIDFEFTPETIETRTFLGIDRGAAMIGSATVVDRSGVVVGRSHLEGDTFAREMRRYEAAVAEAHRKGRMRFNFRLRGRRADIVVNEYANALIRLAVEHKSQIVVENLNARSMALFLRQSQVRKLHTALAYKAQRQGLPLPIEVPAAFTSQTCPRCAHKARENRPKTDAEGNAIQDIFRCVACGYEANADENASEVIALRGLHQLSAGMGRFQKFDVFQVWLKGQRSGESATSQLGAGVLSSAPGCGSGE